MEKDKRLKSLSCPNCGFTLLSDKQTKILEMLHETPMSMTEIADNLIISQSLAIYHLNKLLRLSMIRHRLINGTKKIEYYLEK